MLSIGTSRVLALQQPVGRNFPTRAAHLFEIVREAFPRIVIVDGILTLSDDVIGGTADARMHHVERAAAG